MHTFSFSICIIFLLLLFFLLRLFFCGFVVFSVHKVQSSQFHMLKLNEKAAAYFGWFWLIFTIIFHKFCTRFSLDIEIFQLTVSIFFASRFFHLALFLLFKNFSHFLPIFFFFLLSFHHYSFSMDSPPIPFTFPNQRVLCMEICNILSFYCSYTLCFFYTFPSIKCFTFSSPIFSRLQ